MIPVKVWINLSCTLVQKDIQNFTRGFSGVYEFLCIKNNKSYIGSALCKKYNSNRIYTRFKNHLKHRKLSNQILHKAIKKYGINNFQFKILELCNPDSVRQRKTC